MGRGSTCHICGNYYLRDYHIMQNQKSMLGIVTRPRTAIAMIAATLLLGGTVTEASAKSRHHHRHHHHRHHAVNSETTPAWQNANASIAPSSGSGRSFAGVA